MANNTFKLFVYGTLKDYNEPSNYYVNGRLYLINNLPAIKFCDCKPKKILGQVITVTEEQLRTLDIYEGVPHLYKRSKVFVQLLNGEPKDSLVAWVYEYAGDAKGFKEIDEWPVK